MDGTFKREYVRNILSDICDTDACYKYCAFLKLVAYRVFKGEFKFIHADDELLQWLQDGAANEMYDARSLREDAALNSAEYFFAYALEDLQSPAYDPETAMFMLEQAYGELVCRKNSISFDVKNSLEEIERLADLCTAETEKLYARIFDAVKRHVEDGDPLTFE